MEKTDLMNRLVDDPEAGALRLVLLQDGQAN